ncbi:glycosyltransferase family 2 protein [Methylomonas sp. EFPC3]|uniref:glycosyltransferase family 2 protein n=1 Tax=Methylomonas sp. EFPC3 TaxID=3021710 RepID=UPI002417B3DB|nr:glycosyltransferase family 2 protein [Methylomonas sp. EFPC3]WFP48823.1 glycosyltransferase family 2 protein [Methylomonas sp. EFPC3]
MSQAPQLISVIVTTYNRPPALLACLRSLQDQLDRNFEVLVADDGSGEATRQLIEREGKASPIPIRHIWHEDKGFRAGTIRNKAAANANGDYLIFMDGDCIAFPSFIARHRLLAETGYFVPGNRLLINAQGTEDALNGNAALHIKPLVFFIGLWLKRQLNRLLPLINLPLHAWRYLNPYGWEKAMTCNLALWKSDFLAVNGFDEKFEGWGYEDSDLVIRLIHFGCKRKEGRFAVPVLHLWHPYNDRSQHDQNYRRLLERVANPRVILAERGVRQHLEEINDSR